ncbi:hypothetical protein P59_209 [Bacillus phage P59]|nr:hypothetical protein P59_209 [Bacillus phage P59]
MEMIKFLRRQAKEIEEVEEKLFELQTDIIAAEVEHEGRSALIMEVDWEEKAVYLNYDDVNFEWVEFG